MDKNYRKYDLMTEQGVEASKMVAFQTARGAVSDFIHKFIKYHPNAKWPEMKADFAVRFVDIVDKAHARGQWRKGQSTKCLLWLMMMKILTLSLHYFHH